MSQNLEIEIKSLLGSKDNAEKLKQSIKAKWPDLKKKSQYKQLNHYFIPGDFKQLEGKISDYLNEESREKFKDITTKGKSFSVRTREFEGDVILVIKASIDETTSSNGISRMEFESKIPLSLEELDKILLDSGFSYQAKWSREREEYVAPELAICIDKNAGYGYLAEFEKVVQKEEDVPNALAYIKSVMQEFGAEELPQDRLERMFDYYNKNWSEYYGTEKTFTID